MYAATSSPPAADTSTSTAHMNAQEMIAHQRELQERIQQQMRQQMRLQKEISMQFAQQERASLSSSLTRRQSFAAAIKVEPDLGDNVFDMLDDLIMIPSGAVAPERTSISGATAEAVEVDASATGGRDSLADIVESLDLDDFELGTTTKTGDDSISSWSDSDIGSTPLDDRDSFDDSDDLGSSDDDELEDIGGGDMMDIGVDDDDDASELDPTNSPFVPRVDLELNRGRLSSSERINGSISSSASSISTTNMAGNFCTLIWETGMLGLRLRMSRSRMYPAVSKLTGRSSIFGIHLVEVGDLLVEIAGRSTREMDFIESVKYLKEAEKPCKLVFRRLGSDPMAVRPVQPPVRSALALELAKKFDELLATDDEKTPTAPVVKMEERYEVKWLDGPLGISLIASKDAPYPLVTRITGKNRSPQVQDVQPGHYLVQIGAYDTADGNFNTTIKYLQKVVKPVSLFFCPGSQKASARPEPTADEYDHVWEKKQPLAFTVRPSSTGAMAVAELGTAKSVKTKTKGMGVSGTINAGDLIVWINEDCVKDLSFNEALLKLRTAKRPLIIRFMKAPPELPVPPVGIRVSAVHAVAAETTSPKGGRGFNPLKKIAGMGTFTKENPTNPVNQRHSDHPIIAANPRHQDPMTGANPRHQDPVSTSNTRHQEPKRSSFPGPEPPQGKKHSGHGAEIEPKGVMLQLGSGSVVSSATRTMDSGGPESELSPSDRRSALKRELQAALRKPTAAKLTSDAISLDSPARPSSHKQAPPAHFSRNGNRSSRDRPEAGHVRPNSPSHEKHDEYEVVWPEGTALGLTLRVHPTTRFPVVTRVTGAANLNKVSQGDILIAANGIPLVPQPKFKQTLDILSKLPKPAKLRFRRGPALGGAAESSSTRSSSSSVKEYEYDYVWRENTNLGLVFSSDSEGPKVTRVDVESGGPGIAVVADGDVLTCIGGMDIVGSTFQSAMTTLRGIHRPVKLRFRRRYHKATM